MGIAATYDLTLGEKLKEFPTVFDPSFHQRNCIHGSTPFGTFVIAW
jgi:hypothetical protein